MMVTLKEPLFKGTFRVFKGDFREVVRHLKSRGFDAADVGKPQLAKTIWLEHKGCSEVLIWLSHDWSPLKGADQAVLAHEALHGAVAVLKSRRVPLDAIVDEVGNYYVEWLVREINRALTVTRRRRKPR